MGTSAVSSGATSFAFEFDPITGTMKMVPKGAAPKTESKSDDDDGDGDDDGNGNQTMEGLSHGMQHSGNTNVNASSKKISAAVNAALGKATQHAMSGHHHNKHDDEHGSGHGNNHAQSTSGGDGCEDSGHEGNTGNNGNENITINVNINLGGAEGAQAANGNGNAAANGTTAQAYDGAGNQLSYTAPSGIDSEFGSNSTPSLASAPSTVSSASSPMSTFASDGLESSSSVPASSTPASAMPTADAGLTTPDDPQNNPNFFGQLSGQLANISKNITAGNYPEAQADWANYMSKVSDGSAGIDINALIQMVMRNAYEDNQQDLKYYAEKLQFYNNQKKAIRDQITAAHNAEGAAGPGFNSNSTNFSYNAPGAVSDTFTGSANITDMFANIDGNQQQAGTSDAVGGRTITNKNDMDNYIQDLENQLSTVGDDAQLAQVDLQNMTQKQQQTLQTLSDLSKSFHDLSMAIIRKIGS